LYTPAFGSSTKTNQFGAEAVLIKAGQPNQYRVTDVCTVFDTTANPPRCSNAGNNLIPPDGFVLSAAPGGAPDVRLFIRDYIKKDDLVRVFLPIRRVASRVLDAVDPTPATNPPGIDPNTGACYPGCRGAGQFIQYTPAFGARTRTNDFGYEITVVNGRVSARGGNNSPIPSDGFVLSGHSDAGNWLASNSILGAAVVITGTTVTITIDPSAYLVTAHVAIERAAQSLTTAQETCQDIPQAEAQTALDQARVAAQAAQAALDRGDDQGAVEQAQVALDQANIAYYRSLESRVVEARGVWVRPTEKTRVEIAATLDRMAQAGFNLVYLETFYNGFTIFPSATATRYGIAPQRPEFVGIDALQVWIEEAHLRGLQLHAWVENFFVGGESLGGPGPILSVYPEWAAVERQDVGKPGPQPSAAENSYYFLDPAIPEARRYLLDLYTEMLRKYNLDGLHLDYIRYPISLPLENSFSYSDHSRQAFQAEYGVDPYTITPDGNPDAWTNWVAWRQNNITSFVEQIRTLIDAGESRAALSAAVFPDEFDSKIKKLQDWERWTQRGWMDFMAGMSFGRSAESVANDTAAMRKTIGDQALIYTGAYGPFLALPPDTMVDQVNGIRAHGGHGVSLFAWGQISQPYIVALREGPYRRPAITPHDHPVPAVATGVQDLRRRVTDVYVPDGCLDARLRQPVTRALDRLTELLQRDTPGSRVAAITQLDVLQRLLKRENRFIDPALAERLAAELALYTSVLNYARER
jgi:uncharacterized lipoprotein YddW (UPF0748 family)